MKYKIKEYAIALVDSILEDRVSHKIMANNFLNFLEKQGDLKNAKKIIELSEKYYLNKKGNKKIVVETARKTNIKNLIKYLYKEGDIIKEIINKSIIAGVKVTINDENEFDASLFGKLKNIF